MTPTATLLGVLAKFWQPGDVKTRLGAAIGDRNAALLHRHFVETTLQRLTGRADRCEVCYTPADREADFHTILPPGWEATSQAAGDLGARMRAFFDRAFASGASRVVLVGADTPNLPIEHIDLAFQSLIAADVVLGPAADGGYYLVGAKHATPPIFGGIEWGTPVVWEQTIAALERSGRVQGGGYAILPPWNDVDTLDDLLQLEADLQTSSRGDSCLSDLAAAVHNCLAHLRAQGEASIDH